jgi:glycerol uptake facilitator-like aquaporin
MRMSLPRRVIAEFFGTAFLVAAVVGSGIMGDRLANGNVALALLANTIATGAALVALIIAFGSVSGAHLNPVVTCMDAFEGGLPWKETLPYMSGQVLGGMGGAVIANLMFGLPAISVSIRSRSGPAQVLSEFVANSVSPASFGVLLGFGQTLFHSQSVRI